MIFRMKDYNNNNNNNNNKYEARVRMNQSKSIKVQESRNNEVKTIRCIKKK